MQKGLINTFDNIFIPNIFFCINQWRAQHIQQQVAEALFIDLFEENLFIDNNNL